MRSTLARPGATLARPARRVVSVPGSASGMGTSQAEASSSAPNAYEGTAQLASWILARSTRRRA